MTGNSFCFSCKMFSPALSDLKALCNISILLTSAICGDSPQKRRGSQRGC